MVKRIQACHRCPLHYCRQTSPCIRMYHEGSLPKKYFEFFKNILTCGDYTEYGGFNTKICGEQGRALEPKTKMVYLPLIDTDPADPSRMKTAMVEEPKDNSMSYLQLSSNFIELHYTYNGSTTYSSVTYT